MRDQTTHITLDVPDDYELKLQDVMKRCCRSDTVSISIAVVTASLVPHLLLSLLLTSPGQPLYCMTVPPSLQQDCEYFYE